MFLVQDLVRYMPLIHVSRVSLKVDVLLLLRSSCCVKTLLHPDGVWWCHVDFGFCCITPSRCVDSLPPCYLIHPYIVRYDAFLALVHHHNDDGLFIFGCVWCYSVSYLCLLYDKGLNWDASLVGMFSFLFDVMMVLICQKKKIQSNVNRSLVRWIIHILNMISKLVYL